MASNAMKALLGVLAVAGYQNRDKIAEMLRGIRTPTGAGVDGHPQSDGLSAGGGMGGGLGGLGGGGGLGDLLGSLTGGGSASGGGLAGGLGGLFGGGLSAGLGDLLRQFEQKGQGETAKSWVGTGENHPIDDRQLSEVLGPDVLADLATRTGLSPEEIVKRLQTDLPAAVNDLTPDGRIPGDEEPIATTRSVPNASSGPSFA